MPVREREDGDAPAGAVRRTPSRFHDGIVEACGDWVAEEVPVAFAFNGEPFAVMMATPADIEDFALGFAFSEGIVDAKDALRIDAVETTLDGIAVSLTVSTHAQQRLTERRRNIEGRSGCGICGASSVEAVLRPPRRVAAGIHVTPRALSEALAALQARQPLNAHTGATHAAAWADAAGTLLLVREDVGRHNALDKLIGAMRSAGIDADAGFCVVTSRASFEMAMKAAQAGMPMLAAISAPTALAIAMADTAGMTLVGFARGDGCVAYAHPWRLQPASVSESSP